MCTNANESGALATASGLSEYKIVVNIFRAAKNVVRLDVFFSKADHHPWYLYRSRVWIQSSSYFEKEYLPQSNKRIVKGCKDGKLHFMVYKINGSHREVYVWPNSRCARKHIKKEDRYQI